MALVTMGLREPDDERPWERGLGYSKPQQVATWEALAAESRRQQVHLGMVEGQICRCQECSRSRGAQAERFGVSAVQPEPVKPKSSRRTSRRKHKTPETPQAKAWHSLHEIREHLRAERGEDLHD